MSSSSIPACFDSTLEYLEPLSKRHASRDFHFLKVDVSLLKALFLCTRTRRSNHLSYLECGCEQSNCASFGCNVSFRIEDLVFRNTQQLQTVCGTSDYYREWCQVRRFRENIRAFWIETREELCCILLDERCIVGVPDEGRLMDLVDSLLDILVHLPCSGRKDEHDMFEARKKKLMFLKNFISFFTLQGVVHVQVTELLIAVEFVAVKEARLIYLYWYRRGDLRFLDFRVYSEGYCPEISELLQKFEPVDTLVQETWFRVSTALRLSRSSSVIPLTLGKNWQVLAADLLNSLFGNLWNPLHCATGGFVNDQEPKLYKGLTCLKYLLRQHQEKFDNLHDKMKDLIIIMVYGVGIAICSLSPNEKREGLAKETNNVFSHLLEGLEFIMAEVSQFYPSCSFPRTNELGSIDFLLKNIKELASCETDSIAFLKDQIHIVQEGLVFLRSFLESIAEQRNQNDKLQALWSRVMEVAYKAEFVIDSVMADDKPYWPSMPLDIITEEIEILKIEANEIYDSMRHDSQPQRVTKDFIRMQLQVSTPALNEFLVDLDDEVNAIINRLERGSKYLDIVSIVGMPGLGKTTLANKVYHKPSIKLHFHIHAWCTVSQVYSKHNLLVQILRDCESPDKCLNKSEDDLAELLYKRLQGNRYLIVLDDVWDIDAWNTLKELFPDDANGSRILFTSRFHNLSLQIKLDSKPHSLRPFTDAESWALLQSKLFGKDGCPPALSSVGMQIAKNCKGLPLTVAIVAGILATIKQDCWEEVANSLSLSTVIGAEHCMKTLELSYSHLPDYLKPCLLYFGAFGEERDIPVRSLVLPWIAEGFVQKTEEKKLEDVADEYLMDLISRSLVTVTDQRTIGGAKACRIHDLLHEFCVVKAKEERFLQIFHGYNEISTYGRPYDPRRLCIYSKEEEFINSRLLFPHLRCLLLFDGKSIFFDRKHLFFIFTICKLLRVLDLGDVFF